MILQPHLDRAKIETSMKLGRDIGKECVLCYSSDVMMYLLDACGTGDEDNYCKDCMLKSFEADDLVFTPNISREQQYIKAVRRACFALVKRFDELKYDRDYENMLVAKFQDCVILNLKLMMNRDYDEIMITDNLPLLIMRKLNIIACNCHFKSKLIVGTINLLKKIKFENSTENFDDALLA